MITLCVIIINGNEFKFITQVICPSYHKRKQISFSNTAHKELIEIESIIIIINSAIKKILNDVFFILQTSK